MTTYWSESGLAPREFEFPFVAFSAFLEPAPPSIVGAGISQVIFVSKMLQKPMFAVKTAPISVNGSNFSHEIPGRRVLDGFHATMPTMRQIDVFPKSIPP